MPTGRGQNSDTWGLERLYKCAKWAAEWGKEELTCFISSSGHWRTTLKVV